MLYPATPTLSVEAGHHRTSVPAFWGNALRPEGSVGGVVSVVVRLLILVEIVVPPIPRCGISGRHGRLARGIYRDLRVIKDLIKPLAVRVKRRGKKVEARLR